MRKTAFAIAWVLLGALVTLVLVADPLHVHSIDDWLRARLEPAADGSQAHPREAAQLYTCPMHPQIIEDHPGTCPICGMDLVPVQQPAGPVATPPTSAASARTPAARLWTCPMHPQIVEDHPGSCPICGMDLVPLKAEPAGDHASDHGSPDHGQASVVRIDPTVVQNMNVTTEPVRRRDLAHRIRTVGSLDYDLDGMVTVTTRYPGFVEKVYVESIGQQVRRGDPLFEVYAPELVQTQRELLSAIRYAVSLADAPDDVRSRAEELVEAARTRLEYWDLTAEQIRSIERDGTVHRTVTVFAPSSGIVMQRTHGLEGMAIQPGMDVIHIADLSKLLLTAEVYEDQLRWVTIGMPASVDLTYLPGERFVGRVRYVEPEVQESTRTVRLIVEVPNPAGRLRVGMYANVQFEPVGVRNAVSVPIQAVLRTGARDVVVVALGEGRFAPREVGLGIEGDDGYVQVITGLDGGEEIVTSAQFLIDSESNLRAAIQQMTGR